MNPEIENKYIAWCGKANLDPDLQEELCAIASDEAAIEDAFYRDLDFGTAGLRGVIGAGTNRMNVYTVGRTAQGLANYVIGAFPEGKRSIAIAYDSRIKADLFAKVSAAVFAMNGIKAYIYPQLMPTPLLSWAVRRLGCSAGVMVTASHNPAKYNGYKVYGSDGCQITTEAANTILSEIGRVDIFADVKFGDFDALMAEGKIEYVSEEVYTEFIERVKKESVLGPDDQVDRNVAIVYTPLNGTGLKPVTRMLRETGFTNITVVAEQRNPDGNFPTCPYPNPEIREAMALGMKYAEEEKAELLLATDPDADRCGIAVADKDGNYVLLSGNETGCLLLDYICSQRIKNGTMPEDPMMVKTIVTTDMAEKIADHYSVRCVNVLTGFKYIGDQIALLEKDGKESSYIFGFEESYGYLSGGYVRDKDAVDAAFLICEMFAFYKSRGISLLDKLNELYDTYGYYKNVTHSFEFEGIAGIQKMADVMAKFRAGDVDFAGRKVEKTLDYTQGIDGLPKSDVLKYFIEGGTRVIARPSGTEPKLKVYVLACGATKDLAAQENDELSAALKGAVE
ncbi:MAG: phospho-sugar mutase [Lachnospiraceae bacterium]|nr:phospho-sugar mutase [Lachnospiraceae bacterium]